MQAGAQSVQLVIGTLKSMKSFMSGARKILPPEVGVAQRYDPGHGPAPFRSNRTSPPNDMLVTLHRGCDSVGAEQGSACPAEKGSTPCS